MSAFNMNKPSQKYNYNSKIISRFWVLERPKYFLQEAKFSLIFLFYFEILEIDIGKTEMTSK